MHDGFALLYQSVDKWHRIDKLVVRAPQFFPVCQEGPTTTIDKHTSEYEAWEFECLAREGTTSDTIAYHIKHLKNLHECIPHQLHLLRERHPPQR